MSRSLYRVKSACPGGQLNLAHQNQLLKDQISKLQQDLVTSKADCQKVTDQLNCLITLVKRSWNGDSSASVHVANIVGAAPPDLQIDEMDIATDPVIQSKPKSRAVNNWAMLAIGILNRQYKYEEQVKKSQQNLYLKQRVHYLEEQELYHRDMRLREAQLEKPAVYKDYVKQDIQKQPGLARRRNSQDRGHVFLTQGQNSRPSSGKKSLSSKKAVKSKSDLQEDGGLTWADLVIDSTAKIPNVQYDKQGVMMYNTGFNDGEAEYFYEDVAYDDPERYNMHGLYDASSVPRLMQKRPPSGKQQKQNDNLRSRPKSAIYSSKRAERPLKYETTRPLSATSSKSKREQQATGKTNTKTKAKVPTNLDSNPRPDSEAGPFPSLEDYEDSYTDDHVDLDVGRPIKVDIKKPESVVKFEQDMDNMKKMELDFQKTTLALQKKLGISSNGIVS